MLFLSGYYWSPFWPCDDSCGVMMKSHPFALVGSINALKMNLTKPVFWTYLPFLFIAFYSYFYLDEDTPFVVLRTLKQRETQSKAGQTKVKVQPKRIVALFEPQYVQMMKSYFVTMRLKNQSQIWPVQSDNTVRNWLRNAVERAENQGLSYIVNPVTCKTFRHSFAMHLIFNGVPMKVIQAYLGHKKSCSTDIYTKIFSLDAMLHFDISFR